MHLIQALGLAQPLQPAEPLCAEVFEECDEDSGLILLDEHAQTVSVLIRVRSWYQKKAGFGMFAASHICHSELMGQLA